METKEKWAEEWRPAAAMVAANVAFGLMNVLIKKAIDGGMSCLALITLRQLVATVFMAPVACFRERGSCRPKLTPAIFVYLFFSALLGASLTQYLFFVGLRYTSATFACAFLNMTPVITFLIALVFRLEKLDVRTTGGLAKVLGTAVTAGGAMLLTFYRGVALTHHRGSLHFYSAPSPSPAADDDDSPSGKRTIGTAALLGGCLSWCCWFFLQSKVSKKYPALYSGTAIIFFLSFLEAAALTFATQDGASLLAVRGKLQIFTVLYAGIVGSGVGFVVMSWSIRKRGPAFPAAFSPLIQIVVAVIEVSVMHQQLHLGSVLGSALVILGLYALLWGKNREGKRQLQLGSQGSQGIKEPV